ncbi:MAG: hypothetical protein ACRYFS_24855 [Janthinobacterium lividum]
MSKMTILSQQEMEQLSQRGWWIYEEKLKPILEPQDNGKVVAIHLDSGDYEVARNSPSASKAMRIRHPSGLLMVTDIGPARMDSLTLHMMGSQLVSGESK